MISLGVTEPDFDAFRANVLRLGTPRRVHHLELKIDDEVKDAIGGRHGLEVGAAPDDPHFGLRRDIVLHRFLGHDTFRVYLDGTRFPRELLDAGDTAAGSQSRGTRAWTDETVGPIAGWEDFERYPWPTIEAVDLSPLEWLDRNLPDDMKVGFSATQILEQVTWLLGYESLCLKLYDAPDLVDAMFARVGEFFLRVAETVCQFDCLGLIFGGDDMGYKTGTLIAPEILIEKSLCWHKRIAAAAHRAGRLYLLHSCGNVTDVMDYLIDEVRIDGRHSYEDAIEPVTEAKRRYGDRIAILGGIDVDFLCRSDEAAIRRRVRETLDVCMPGGGYCLGTGNSVANYIPVENYLVMVDEGRRYGS